MPAPNDTCESSRQVMSSSAGRSTMCSERAPRGPNTTRQEHDRIFVPRALLKDAGFPLPTETKQACHAIYGMNGVKTPQLVGGTGDAGDQDRAEASAKRAPPACAPARPEGSRRPAGQASDPSYRQRLRLDLIARLPCPGGREGLGEVPATCKLTRRCCPPWGF